MVQGRDFLPQTPTPKNRRAGAESAEAEEDALRCTVQSHLDAIAAFDGWLDEHTGTSQQHLHEVAANVKDRLDTYREQLAGIGKSDHFDSSAPAIPWTLEIRQVAATADSDTTTIIVTGPDPADRVQVPAKDGKEAESIMGVCGGPPWRNKLVLFGERC